jgi:potassium-dependent mechanosensitive channel
MSLFKFLVYCLFVYLSLIGLPVNAQQAENPETTDTTTVALTQEWIEERKSVITKEQAALEKAQKALQEQEQAFPEKKATWAAKTDKITQNMLEKAAIQRQAANQLIDDLRIKRQSVQDNLEQQKPRLTELETTLKELTQFRREVQTIAQNQRIDALEQDIVLPKQAVELEQQHLDILQAHIEVAIKQALLAMQWHSDLQTWPQEQRIKEREEVMLKAQVGLEHTQKALQTEHKELPDKIATLEATQLPVDKLSKMFEKAALNKDAADVDVQNLGLEIQSAETNLERQQKILAEDQEKLDTLRKTPAANPEQEKLQAQRVLEFENKLKLQQKTLELDEQQLEILKQRLVQAEKRLELAIEWHDNVQIVHKVRQKQELEAQIQKERQRHLARAAELRWELEKLPPLEENTAQRYLLKVKIQEANELAEQVVRQLKVQHIEGQIQQGQKAIEQKTTEVFSQTQLDNTQSLIQETTVLLEDVMVLQALLENKGGVLKQQQEVVKKVGSHLKGQASKYNKEAQKVLAKLQNSLQKELDHMPTLLANTEELLTLAEKTYQEELRRALFRPRQLPTNTAEWQTLIDEIKTMPSLFGKLFMLTGRGFVQAFQQTKAQDWMIIGIAMLIWLFVAKIMSAVLTWLINALSRDEERGHLLDYLLLGLQLLRMNMGSIAVAGVVLLLLWLIQPTHLTILVTSILLLVWLGAKLLINLSKSLLFKLDPPRIKIHRQLRWAIIVISLLTVITALVHVESEGYVLKFSLMVRDLIDTVFMFLLGLLVFPLLRIRQVMLTTLQKSLEGYWLLVTTLMTLLIPLSILAVSILGLIGYISLGWAVAKNLMLLVVVLTAWLIARGLLADVMNFLRNLTSERGRYGSLWSEDIIPLVHKLLGFTLFVVAIITLFWLMGWLSDTAVRENIKQVIEFKLVTLGDGSTITVKNVFLSILIIWIVFWLGGWSRGVTNRWVYLGIKDVGLRNSLSVFTQYAVIIIGLLFALKAIGIDPTALTVFAGAVGVGIGFGLQNIVNNFVSGILILIGRPFRVGDLIKVGSSGELLVQEINWLDTRLSNPTNTDMVMANSTLLGSQIENFDATKKDIWFWPSIYVDPRFPPEYINKLLSDAMSSVDVVVDVWPMFAGVNEWSAEYWACFSIKKYSERWEALPNVWNQIWIHFNRAGVQFAVRRHEIYTFDGQRERSIPSGTVPAEFYEKTGTVPPASFFQEEKKASEKKSSIILLNER